MNSIIGFLSDAYNYNEIYFNGSFIYARDVPEVPINSELAYILSNAYKHCCINYNCSVYNHSKNMLFVLSAYDEYGSSHLELKKELLLTKYSDLDESTKIGMSYMIDLIYIIFDKQPPRFKIFYKNNTNNFILRNKDTSFEVNLYKMFDDLVHKLMSSTTHA